MARAPDHPVDQPAELNTAGGGAAADGGSPRPRPKRLGGQAVLEGVMVRADDRLAVAVRRPDGTVVCEVSPVPAWDSTLRGVPVVRGVVALVSTVALGMRALGWSRAVLEGATGDGDAAAGSTAAGATGAGGKGDGGSSRAQVLAATILSLTVFVSLFALGPAAVARVVAGHGLWFGVVEAVVRMAMFVGYIAAIGRLPGIRRTFEYHGAEHQAIGAFEAGAELELATVRTFSPRHARCGTDFLVLVGLVAIVAFIAVSPEGWVALGVSRLVLLPVVAGVAYEMLRVADRPRAKVWLRPLLAPGMAVQRLTTRPPSDDQIEVAITAVRAAVG